jgi:ribosomal peptide maturation radical SAM protein 1
MTPVPIASRGGVWPEEIAVDLSTVLGAGDALLVVPPFASLDMPSMAVHLLQACARQDGVEVKVLYSNILLASMIGQELYEEICKQTSCRTLLGERLFAAAAYGLPPLGRNTDSLKEFWETEMPEAARESLPWPAVQELESGLARWADAVAEGVARCDFRVVGCTTSYEQTSASIALLRRIKTLRPDILTAIGGANCEAEMAEGIASLGGGIDVIFSGESEASWPAYLRQVLTGAPPMTNIVYGSPCRDLDALPSPSFEEFFDQGSRHLPDARLAESAWLPYESSRGCWWGEKSHCTFCGLNGQQMKFRERSSERVLTDLRALTEGYPTRKVCLLDNIMPFSYFKTLIPRLGAELPGLRIHSEQKANLSLRKVIALKQAGMTDVQPGIEALSTSLLARMKKGVSAIQNIALLRYARATQMILKWNLLVHFPGDELREYEETLGLLPMLRHLFPPGSLSTLSIDRFSPYFDRPADYGIQNVRPVEAYLDVFPPSADVPRLAYHFSADYPSAARQNPKLLQEIEAEVEAWRTAWSSGASQPVLHIECPSANFFLLRDTRGLPGTDEFQILSRAEASVALVGRHPPFGDDVEWALGRKLGVLIDRSYVPLAIAEPDLLLSLEEETLSHRQPAAQVWPREMTP